jgi:hypothetical protein
MSADTPPIDPIRPTDTMLLDIFERLGAIQQQNRQILDEQGRAADGRRAMHGKLDTQGQAIAVLKSQVEDIKPKVETAAGVKSDVDAMKPTVKDMESIRLKLAVASVIAGAIVGGAVQLVWLGFSHVSEIAEFFRRVMR